jgi:aryl-alcohol dehydrogenase-like predicted oxidoreductase
MNFKYVNGIKVSSIVLGSDSFGTIIDEQTAFSLMDKFCSFGGNTIDTARIYGAHFGGDAGDSEAVIGKWLSKRGKREDVVISTKCAHPNLATMDISRLSKKEIEDDVDKSLVTLKTDYIDILWLHRDDINVSVDEIIDTLDGLVKKGKIRRFL